MLAEEIDNVISNITNISGNQSKGTTSYAEMQKTLARFQQEGFNIDISGLYQWSETLHGFVLSGQGVVL